MAFIGNRWVLRCSSYWEGNSSPLYCCHFLPFSGQFNESFWVDHVCRMKIFEQSGNTSSREWDLLVRRYCVVAMKQRRVCSYLYWWGETASSAHVSFCWVDRIYGHVITEAYWLPGLWFCLVSDKNRFSVEANAQRHLSVSWAVVFFCKDCTWTVFA